MVRVDNREQPVRLGHNRMARMAPMVPTDPTDPTASKVARVARAAKEHAMVPVVAAVPVVLHHSSQHLLPYCFRLPSGRNRSTLCSKLIIKS